MIYYIGREAEEYNVNKFAGKAPHSSHVGIKNPMFGKHHSSETIAKIRAGNLGKYVNEATRIKQSIALGTPIYLYVVCPNSPSGFCFIRSFVSYREAGRYFGLAHTAISSRLISGNFINFNGLQYKVSRTKIDE